MRANKRLHRIMFGCCILVCSASTTASDLNTDRLQSFAMDTERAAFTQTKHIQGLPRPLVSQGYVELTEDRLEWVSETPVFNRIVVTHHGVYEVEGETEQRISGSETVGQLLLSLLNQDYEYLQRYFTVARTDTECLQLTPKREPLSSMYRMIKACGMDRLESVALVEVQGNRTSIQLRVEQE